MPVPICNKCKRQIPSDDINVGADVAYCRVCNFSHKLSTLTYGAELDETVDLMNPPARTWYNRNGQEFVIGASSRALGTAAGLLAISLFWNGIVSVFVAIAIAGTLHRLGLPVPSWFPAPNMNGSPMGTGMVIFLWLFLTPFILIGASMVIGFLMSLAGRVEVRLRHGEGWVFTGIGAVGFRRRFDPSAIQEVRLLDDWNETRNGRQRKTFILLELREGKQVKFGSGLPEMQRKFMAGAIRKTLPV